MDEIIRYILLFLLKEEHLADMVYYGKAEDSAKPITIVRSSFFDDNYYGKACSMPCLPLQYLEYREYSLPFLYGDKRIESVDGRIVIYADLIASSYFLLSRYDEAFFEVKRDIHRRPIGKESFKAQAKILDRPLVDEYSDLLIEMIHNLGIDVCREKGLNHIYLTHDVDHPWKNYTVIDGCKTAARDIIRYKHLDISPILNGLGIYVINACDAFDWILEQDSLLKQVYKDLADDVYFFIGTNQNTEMTQKYWDDPKIERIVGKIKQRANILGIHASYEAGIDGDLFVQEKTNVENLINNKVTANRNHYLLSSTADWQKNLVFAGITDDYSIGYADTLGYRMSTCRSVHWINPYKKRVENLLLHPLLVMDSTLMEEQYMNLEVEAAFTVIKNVVDICYKYRGDFCILLHNDIPNDVRYSWWKPLYEEVIQYICKLHKDRDF